jgi:hypothetical protein
VATINPVISNSFSFPCPISASDISVRFPFCSRLNCISHRFFFFHNRNLPDLPDLTFATWTEHILDRSMRVFRPEVGILDEGFFLKRELRMVQPHIMLVTIRACYSKMGLLIYCVEYKLSFAPISSVVNVPGMYRYNRSTWYLRVLPAQQCTRHEFLADDVWSTMSWNSIALLQFDLNFFRLLTFLCTKGESY